MELEKRSRAHVARLDSNQRQNAILDSQAHNARVLWNLLHEYCTFRQGRLASLKDCDEAIREARKEIDWLKDLPAQAAQAVLKTYQQAWKNFFNLDHPAGRPTFKSRMDKVVFTSGRMFGDGGWFAGGLRVQVRRGHQWVDVSGLRITPGLPVRRHRGAEPHVRAGFQPGGRRRRAHHRRARRHPHVHLHRRARGLLHGHDRGAAPALAPIPHVIMTGLRSLTVLRTSPADGVHG